MKNLSLFCLLIFIFPLFLAAQESYDKEQILSARKTESEKEKNRKFCAGLPGLQGLGDNRCFTIYPTEIIYWGKGFSEGLAKITVDGKAGFINTKGEIVVKPNLKDAGYFAENLAPFENKNGKWGFIDKSGEIAIKPQFDWALSFKEGLALVQTGELWGFIDKSGNFVIEPKFKEAASFSEGLARVGVFDKDFVHENTNIPNGKTFWGFIDKQGNWAIKPTLYYAYKDFDGGMALVSRNVKTEKHTYSENYFIDKTGRELWVLDSWLIMKFSNDLLVIEDGKDDKGNNRHTFIDRSGKRLTDKRFSNLSSFSEELASANKTFGGKYGFINKKGDFVIEPKFDSARSFSEGLAGAKLEDDGFGFIDKTGKWAIKPQFGWVWEFHEGFALVAPDSSDEEREKTGYIDRQGNYIWKPTK